LLFLILSQAQQVGVPSSQGELDSRLRQLQGQAQSALARGQTDAAIAALRDGLKIKPDWKEGLWELGWTLFRQARYGAARPVFVSLLRLDQSRGAPWLLLGLCEFEARDYGMALEDLQRGRALGIPADLGITPAVRYHIANGLTLAGKFESALDLLAEAARAGEHAEEILMATGLAAMHLPALPSQAPELFSRGERAMLRDVGEALYQGARQNRTDADRIYGRLLQQAPVPPKLHSSYGYYLLEIGDLQTAEKEYRAELAVDPESALARCGLAHIALDRGELASATERAREAVRLSPEWGAARFLLGKALLRSGQVPDSIAELEAARDLEPASSKIRFTLLQAYREANRRDEAEREALEVKRLKQAEAEMKAHGRIPASLLQAPDTTAQSR
jgi:Flp pilus assembly protein TadD